MVQQQLPLLVCCLLVLPHTAKLALDVPSSASASGPCYRRRNINLGKCTHSGANAEFTLYALQRGENVSWVEQ